MKVKYLLRSRNIFISIISGFFLTSFLFGEVNVKEYTFRGGNEEDKAAYFAQQEDVSFWGTGKYPEDTSFMGKMFKMSTGNIKFVLWCSGKINSETNEWQSSIGMVKPSKANWNGSQFYDVIISGKKSSNFKTTIEEVKGGEKGEVKITWHHPDAIVTTDFILLDGDDKLLIETKVQPKTDIKMYQICLLCYPSSYGGDYQSGFKIRDREAMTGKRIIKRPELEDNTGYINVTIEKDEPWVLLYDKYFDVYYNRGEGPCAFAYSPEEVEKTTLSIQNYACWIYLDYSATTISHLALWDFKGMSNQTAEKYMKDLEIK